MLPIVILAGGLGTRLGSLAGDKPKPLVDVHGEPFLAHQLRLLSANGLRRVVVSVAYRADLIEDAIGDGSRFGLSVEYVHDGATRLGTGGAVRRARPLLGDMFFVMYGDTYLDVDYEAVQRAFEQSGRLGLMVVFRNDGRWDRSNVRFADGRIHAYDKWHPTPEMHYIDFGLGAFHGGAFDDVPSDGPMDLAVVYQRLLASDQLAGFEVSTRFYEVGSPQGLEEFRRLVGNRQEHTS